MRWRQVTHVLNCVGQYLRDGRENPDWTVVHQQEHRLGGVIYMNWCLTFNRDRSTYYDVFNRLLASLQDPHTVLYVHCRNGKDRSATTVYALLRVLFGMDDDEAWIALQERKSVSGEPLLPRPGLFEDCRRWIHSLNFD